MMQKKITLSLLLFVSVVLASCDLVPTIEEYTPPKENDTLDVAQAIRYVKYLGVETYSPYRVFVKGVITSISTSRTFEGYATFKISDPGDKNTFTCYQVKYLQNQIFTKEGLINVGDTVIVHGKVHDLNGIEPETQGNGSTYIYSINGQTELSKSIDPNTLQTITIAQAMEIIDTMPNPYSTEQYVIKGEIIRIIDNDNSVRTNQSVTFTFIDSTSNGLSMTALAIKNIGNQPFNSLAEVPLRGSIVSMIGKLHKFGTEYQLVTGYINEIIKQGDGTASIDEPQLEPIDPKEGDTLTVEQAVRYTKQLGNDVLSPVNIYIKGTIGEINSINTDKGFATFKINDYSTTDQLKCDQVRYLQNTPFTNSRQLTVGDEVTIYGKVLFFSGVVPQTESNSAAYVYSINGTTELPLPQIFDVSISQAISIIDLLDKNEVSYDYYQIVGTIDEIKTTDANIQRYGNVDLIISDSTGSMTAYRTMNIDSTAFVSAEEVPPVGATVRIFGQLQKYNTTYEMINCYIKEIISLPEPEIQPQDSTTEGIAEMPQKIRFKH